MLVGAGDEVTDELAGVFADLGFHEGAPGEGVAFLMLERVDLAQQRDARIYAMIRGFGHGMDASCRHDRFSTTREPMAASLRAALAAAAVSVDAVDLFSGSTSPETSLGRLESSGLSEVFGSRDVAVLEPQVGHFESAGVLRVAAACLVLATGREPPRPGVDPASSVSSSPYRSQGARTRLRVAVHHALGRGGQSTSLVLALL
jgi:3-oxoacyl-(acyl-carrier-protein) synthase